MRVPGNLDIYEMHEREEIRRNRRRITAEQIDRFVDKEIEEKRPRHEKRTTSKG